MIRKGFEGNWLTRQARLLPIIALAAAFTSAAPAESAARHFTIFVSTVAQLYEAVNNPANAGDTLVLAAGTYTLSATASPSTAAASSSSSTCRWSVWRTMPA